MVRLTVLFALLPVLAFSKPRLNRVIPMISLNPEQQVLYITMIDNIGDYIGESDRYYELEETLEKVLEETHFPMEYKIVRFGSRVPKDQPELQLYVHKWGNNGLGEIEVRLNATLKETSVSRNKNKLGFVRQTNPGFAIIGHTRMREVYNDTMMKALIEIIQELKNHFQLEVDEPALRPETLSPSLGTPIPDQ